MSCESCYQVICECKEITAEQEAIERLQEMPVADAVAELWTDHDAELIAKVLLIEEREVLDVLGVDA